jgi:hypothetical protein
MPSDLVQHKGGCHCGRVKFTVAAPAEIEAVDCNCSICTRTGFLHLLVQKSHFHLLQGSDSLATYTFNTGTAKHLFCRFCGIKSFYVPRSHPEGYSVNVRCLEPGTVKTVTVIPFDGSQWEKSAGSLRSLSE